MPVIASVEFAFQVTFMTIVGVLVLFSVTWLLQTRVFSEEIKSEAAFEKSWLYNICCI